MENTEEIKDIVNDNKIKMTTSVLVGIIVEQIFLLSPCHCEQSRVGLMTWFGQWDVNSDVIEPRLGSAHSCTIKALS